MTSTSGNDLDLWGSLFRDLDLCDLDLWGKIDLWGILLFIFIVYDLYYMYCEKFYSKRLINARRL